MADLFAVAERKAAEAEASSGAGESYVLVLGSKQGGKSTLIQAFLQPSKEDTPKPTIALEYVYGRRGTSSSSGKEIAHVWELGGCSHALAELLSIPLTPARLPTNIVVLVVDLSKPASALATASKLLTTLRGRMTEILDKMRSRPGAAAAATSTATPEALTTAATARLRLGYAQRSGTRVPLTPSAAAPSEDAGTAAASAALASPAVISHLMATLPEHPDARIIAGTMLPCHTLIVGTKWDAIADADAPVRRAVAAALRFLAHTSGAHLMTTSTRGADKASMATFRAFMNAAVFGSETVAGLRTDVNKPLAVPAGADTMEIIGAPSGATRADVEAGALEARADKYIAPVRAFFPAGEKDADDDVDVSNAPPPPSAITPGVPVRFTDEASSFPEPSIDALRVSKAEELAVYVREQERKLRMEAKASQQSSAPAAATAK